MPAPGMVLRTLQCIVGGGHVSANPALDKPVARRSRTHRSRACAAKKMDTVSAHHQLADGVRRFATRRGACLARGIGRSSRRPVTYLCKTLAMSV